MKIESLKDKNYYRNEILCLFTVGVTVMLMGIAFVVYNIETNTTPILSLITAFSGFTITTTGFIRHCMLEHKTRFKLFPGESLYGDR